jgi:membrane protease YdiL (CAAX protease family)
VLLELLLQKRLGGLAANVLVSLLFAVLHIILNRDIAYVSVFFPSLIIGWHYCKFRRVIPVIIAHSAYNFSIY